MSYFAINGQVSSGNSSSVALGAAAAFTGTGEDVSPYSTITVFVDTDQDGTLSMQFSTDNSNWDRQKNVSVDTAIGSGSAHTLEVVAQYFRVVYTNGSTIQTHLRLQTLYHNTKSGFITTNPDQIISKADDAQLVRTVNDHTLDIARGLYGDRVTVHKFGFNAATPAGERDIWSYGSTALGDTDYNWLQSADTVRIAAGGNAADDSGGAGARSITVAGLDSNWNEASEVITTNGGSASSSTSTSFIRVSRAYVTDVGTYTGSNTGGITIETTGGTVVGYISAGLGQTEMTMYTVPANYTAYLRHVNVSVSAVANKELTVSIYQRRNADDTSAPMADAGKRLVHRWVGLGGIADLPIYSMPSFPAKTDIWATTQDTSASTASLDYDLWLVKNDTGTSPQ